jgi:hypothetical protein
MFTRASWQVEECGWLRPQERPTGTGQINGHLPHSGLLSCNQLTIDTDAANTREDTVFAVAPISQGRDEARPSRGFDFGTCLEGHALSWPKSIGGWTRSVRFRARSIHRHSPQRVIANKTQPR